jgi:hypothetical protein
MVKQFGHEVDYSSPTSAKVGNAQTCISSPPNDFKTQCFISTDKSTSQIHVPQTLSRTDKEKIQFVSEPRLRHMRQNISSVSPSLVHIYLLSINGLAV